jgi:hypothetical protein
MMHDRGWGRGRGGAHAEPPPTDDAVAWIGGALPSDWFTGAPEVTIDRDEIGIVGTLAAPPVPDGASEADQAAAEQGRIAAFREETRDRRIRLAQQMEHRYRRKVAWGAVAGGTRQMFSTYSAPVMTRLRQPERQVLDTLVDAGVARSRSEALAWCVRLVGEHSDEWLTRLREAMGTVEQLRRQGPSAADDEE